MRSSIACARCRRSKVKCVNSGVHTTCKACESSGRECVYPVPGGSGAAIVASATNTSSGGTETSGRSGGGVGGNISHSQQGITTGSSAGASSGGGGGDSGGGGGGASGGGTTVGVSGGGGGGGGVGSTAVARHRPKKPSGASTGSHHSHGGMQSGVTPLAGGGKSEYTGGGGSIGKAKGVGSNMSGLGSSQFQGSAQVSIYGALVDNCGIPSADEVLGEVNMTWQFWHAMHGHFQHHYSTELPFVHAPTFLARRLPLPSQHIIPRSTNSTVPHSGNVSGTDDKTSYPLCLGILTLMGRFYPPLIKLHQAHAAAVLPPAPTPATFTSSKGSKSSAASASAAAAAAASNSAEGRRVGEFYAAVLRRYLFAPNNVGEVEVACPTVEKIQALLMLAIHEWIGEGRPERATVWVGLAGKMAGVLGLGRSTVVGSSGGAGVASTPTSSIPEENESAVLEEDLLGPSANGALAGTGAMAMDIDTPDGGGAARKRRKLSMAAGGGSGIVVPALAPGEKEKEKKDLIIREEIARRTFWSLFLLDRQLTAGSKRDLVVRLEDITGVCADRVVDDYEVAAEEEGGSGRTVVRLPCPDKSFTFGDSVCTEVLRISGPGGGGGEQEEQETELCRIIRGMEVWGRVRRWRGPGLQSTTASTGTPPPPAPDMQLYPPTPPQSFYTLNTLISNYSSYLPSNLLFSPDNLNAHIHSKTSTSYAIIHVINFISLMVLHKHNLPFIPPYPTPHTPLNAPSPSHVTISAKEVFRASRGLLDLMKGLTDWNVGVETPLVGYSVYVAGVFAVYAHSFPAMDEERSLATVGDENPHVQTALAQLRRFTSRWNLGGGDGKRWTDGLARLAYFFRRVKAAGANSASTSQQTATLSVVIGTTKGNKTNGHYLAPPTPEEYARYERMFRELGRDELAAWVSPPLSLTGLPPPSAGKGRGSGGGGGSGGGDKKRERVSPQPPIKQGQVGASGSGVTGQGQGVVGDRWHAINKSPRTNPGTSSPPTAATAAMASQTAPGAPQTPAQPSAASPSHSQPLAQAPHQPNHNPTSPLVLVDQFFEQNSIASPKKRHASEMEASIDSPTTVEGAGGQASVSALAPAQPQGQEFTVGQSEGLSLGLGIDTAVKEEGVKMEGVKMEGVKMEGVKMEGVKMEGVKMERVKMEWEDGS